MTIGSFAFSLRLSFVTVRVTVAPAGIIAPFEPLTASATVAVTLSPTLFVFVQIRELECGASGVPAAIVPTAPPPPVVPPLLVVTVLPLGVVTGEGAGFDGVGRGVVRAGVFVRGVVRVGGAVRVGGGALVLGVAAVPAGTSLSCGCAVESRPASDRSRFSVLSAPRLSGPFLDSPPQAARAKAATRAKDAPAVRCRTYRDMRMPPRKKCLIREHGRLTGAPRYRSASARLKEIGRAH